MEYINIDTTINFLSANENVSSSAQTHDVIIPILLVILTSALLIAACIIIYKLKSKATSLNNPPSKTMSKSMISPLVLLSFFITITGILLFISINYFNAIADNEIIVPNTINAYVDDKGNVSIEESKIYSKRGLSLKFDGLETELCDDLQRLNDSIWNIAIDESLIYNNIIPGKSETIITSRDSSKLTISVDGLSPDIAKSLIGKSVFKIKFKIKELQKIDIQFEPNNGQPKWTVQVTEETTLEKPKKDPEKYLADFVAWQKDGTNYDFGLPVTESFTLIASYKNFEAIDYPSWISNPTYNDQVVNVDNEIMWDHYSKQKISISGMIENKNVGNYEVNFNLNHGYYWRDSSEGSELQPYTTYWGIDKRNVSFLGKHKTTTYTGSLKTWTEYETEGLIKNHYSPNVKYSAQGINVGEYDGTITAAADIIINDVDGNNITNNYNISSSPSKLIIEKSSEAWTISLANYSEEYSDSPIYNKNTPQTSAPSGTTTYYYSFDEINWIADKTQVTQTDYTDGGYTLYLKATNTNYLYEAKAESKLFITKKFVSFSGIYKTSAYTGELIVFTDYETTGLLPNHHSINVEYTVQGLDVGEYDGIITDAANILIKNSDENDVTINYEISSTPSKLKIEKSSDSWTITLEDYTEEYSDTPIYNKNTPESSAPSGTTTYYYSYDKSSWKTDVTQVTQTDYIDGGYTLYVKATNTNYSKEATTDSKLTIEKRNVSFNGESAVKEYTGLQIEITGITSNGLVDGHIASVSYLAQGREVGTYQGWITPTENIHIINSEDEEKSANYSISTSVGSLTISPTDDEWNVSMEPYVSDYNGYEQYNIHTLETTAKSGETLAKFSFEQFGDYTDDITSLTVLNATEEAKTIYITAENKNYKKIAYTTTSIKIKKRVLKFQAGDKYVQYTGQEHTGPGLSVVGLVFGHSHNVEYNVASGVESCSLENPYLGEFIIDGDAIKIKDWDNKDVTSNYEISTTVGKLVIMQNQETWNIYLDDYTETYSAQPIYNKNQPSSSAPTGETSYLFSFNQINWTDSLINLTKSNYTDGGYPIYVKATNPNYKFEASTVSYLIINKKELTFTGKNDRFPQTGSEHTITEFKTDGLISPHDHNVSYTATRTDPGTEDGIFSPTKENIKVWDSSSRSTEVTNNYDINTIPGTITIDPQDSFSISLEDFETTYDGNTKYNKNTPSTTALNGNTTYLYSFDETTWMENLEDLTKIDANEEGYIVHVKGHNDYPSYTVHDVYTDAKLIIHKANRTMTITKSHIDLIVDSGKENCLSHPSDTTEIVTTLFDERDIISVVKKESTDPDIVQFTNDNNVITATAINGACNTYYFTICLIGYNYADCYYENFEINVNCFTYIKNNDGQASPDKYIGIDSTSAYVPGTIQVDSDNENTLVTKMVNRLGDGEQRLCYDPYYLETITLDNNIEYINDKCFNGDTHIKKVVTNHMRYIGKEAFEACSNLSSLGNIQVTGDNIIEGNLYLCNIEYRAFYRCSKIETLNLGEAYNLESLGQESFAFCTNINKVKLNRNIKYIDFCAFLRCNSIPTDKYGNQTDVDERVLLNCASYEEEIVNLPSNIEMIASGAYGGKTNIRQVTIANSNLVVCDLAFDGCSNLELFLIKSAETHIQFGKPGEEEHVLSGCGKFDDGRDLIIAGDINNLPHADKDSNAYYFQYTTKSITSDNKTLQNGYYYEMQQDIQLSDEEIYTSEPVNDAVSKSVVDLNGKTIDGQLNTGLFNVVNNSKLWILNTTKLNRGVLKNGINDSGKSKAGAFYVAGESLKIYDCDIVNCRTNQDAGAIFFDNQDENKTPFLYAKNVKFDFCISKSSNDNSGGGAIRLVNSEALIDNCKFEDCSAYAGGAIHSTRAGLKATVSLIIKSTSFSNCFAKQGGGGGAIYIDTGVFANIEMYDTQFTRCYSTKNSGGAIYLTGTERIFLTRCKFHDNWDLKDWRYARGSEKEEDLMGSLFSQHAPGESYIILRDCEGQTSIRTPYTP